MSVSGKFLNSENIARKVFDHENDAIRTTSDSISNIVIDAADGDNIAIHDNDGHELNINPDGSINVNFIGNSNYNPVYTFSEVATVAMGVETNIVSYTVPVGKTALLTLSEMSGTNVSTYNLYVGAILVSKKRSHFASLTADMNFPNGYVLNSGDVVTLKVIHNRPDTGDYEANLQIKESL